MNTREHWIRKLSSVDADSRVSVAIDEIVRLTEQCNLHQSPDRDDVNITVCSSCLRASCWIGQLMCEKARDAGTKEMTVRELRRLNLEHPSYWESP